MPRFFSAAIIISAFIATPLHAHEYYLMPESFTAKIGEQFDVRHRLGQKFKGNEMPWITKWNIRSEAWQAGEKRDVKGLDGDRPALKLAFKKPGLAAVIHQSNVDLLTFSSYEKFQKYVRKEGIEYALADSESGKKPKEGLKEAYSRFAKTLINIGDDETSLDTPTGLKIELVALNNPRALGKDQPMQVQLIYNGKPLEGASVKVFEGVGQEFSYHTKSDANGKASIRAAGKGPYLINAIHMTEPQTETAKKAKSHWESFWASLTFERKQ